MTNEDKIKKSQKLIVIKQIIDDNHVSVSEIHKNTLLDKGGIWKILNGKTKNPQITTVDRIYNYLINIYIANDTEHKYCIIDGNKINYIDIALQVANDEETFMEFKIISNIIDKRVALRLIEVTQSKKSLIDFIKGNDTNIHSNNDS